MDHNYDIYNSVVNELEEIILNTMGIPEYMRTTPFVLPKTNLTAVQRKVERFVSLLSEYDMLVVSLVEDYSSEVPMGCFEVHTVYEDV